MAAEFMHMDAAGYEIAYRHFVSELKAFHERRNGPFRGRPPVLGGRQVDLYFLFQKVISIGGQSAVTAKGRWEEVVSCLELPSNCTNAVYAVRQHYARYLEDYERVHFLGEDEQDPSRLDDAGSSKSLGDGDLAVRHNIRASFPDRRQPNVIKSVSSASSLGDGHVEFRHLRLAIRSGLANEADLALNSCLILSHKSPEKLVFSRMPHLLQAFLAHAGFYHEDILPEVNEGWNQKHCDRLADMWLKTVSTPGKALITTTPAYVAQTSYDSLSQPGDIRWAIRRVCLVATILLNLAHHIANGQYLASSELFCSFSTILLCCNVTEIRHLGEELAVVCGGHFLLEKNLLLGSMAMSPSASNAVMSPLKRRASTRRTWQSVAFDLVLSKDKASALHGLDVIAGFCKANDDATMAVQLPSPCLKQVFAFLTAIDVHLLISSLEALLSLSSLGKFSASLLASYPGSIGQLMTLLSMDVESSMPAAALECVKLSSELIPYPLLKRSDAEGIAKAWLVAFYERQTDQMCSRNQIYNEYAMHCAIKMQPALAILQPAAFWRCLAACYPGLSGVGLAMPGSSAIADMHLRGLHRRATPLPFRVAPPAPGAQVSSSVIIHRTSSSGTTAKANTIDNPAPGQVATSTAVQKTTATSSLARPPAASSVTVKSSSVPVASGTTSPSAVTAGWIQQQLPASTKPAVSSSQARTTSTSAPGVTVHSQPAAKVSGSAISVGSQPLKSQQSISSKTSALQLPSIPSKTTGAGPTNAIATSSLARQYQQQQQQRLVKVSQAIAASLSAVAPVANVTQTVGQVTQAASTTASSTSVSRPAPQQATANVAAAMAASLKSRVAQVAAAAGVKSSLSFSTPKASSTATCPPSVSYVDQPVSIGNTQGSVATGRSLGLSPDDCPLATQVHQHISATASQPSLSDSVATSMPSSCATGSPAGSPLSSTSALEHQPSPATVSSVTPMILPLCSASSNLLSSTACNPSVAPCVGTSPSSKVTLTVDTISSSAVSTTLPASVALSPKQAAKSLSSLLLSSSSLPQSSVTSVTSLLSLEGSPCGSALINGIQSSPSPTTSRGKTLESLGTELISSQPCTSQAMELSEVNGCSSNSPTATSPSSVVMDSKPVLNNLPGDTVTPAPGAPAKRLASLVTDINSADSLPAKRPCLEVSPAGVVNEADSPLKIPSVKDIADRVRIVLQKLPAPFQEKLVNGAESCSTASVSSSESPVSCTSSADKVGDQKPETLDVAASSLQSPPSHPDVVPASSSRAKEPHLSLQSHDTPMDIDDNVESLNLSERKESPTEVQEKLSECKELAMEVQEKLVSYSHPCPLVPCQFGCSDHLELRRHVVLTHINNVTSDGSAIRCQWRGCESEVERHPTNLRCHQMEHVIALDPSVCSMSSPGVRTVLKSDPDAVSFLTEQAPEYALSGTVRLTAALVLYNLARYCPAARLRMHRYQDNLVNLASSTSEAAPTLARCLSELHQHND